MMMKKLPSQTEAHTPKSTPLYQQLYVPTLGGPNPNLLNLDKFVKKYSKISKILFSINLCLGFLLAISICIKIYYIFDYYIHLCKIFEYFIIITLIGNFVWLIASFMVIFGNKKKSTTVIRIYLILMVFCFLIMGCSFIFLKMNSEKCSFKTNMTISLISNCIEILFILILFVSELNLLRILKKIHLMRESYTNNNITDLK